MKTIHVATSPLTSRIFAGHVLKCGTAFSANKQDVTGAACGAVCEYVIANGGTVVVSANGKPKFEIAVRDVESAGDQPAQSVPEGWQLMPLAPTKMILKAMRESTHVLNDHRAAQAYQAAIEAAPKPDETK